MAMICCLEGMPGVGKTSIVEMMSRDPVFQDTRFYLQTDIDNQYKSGLTHLELAELYFESETKKNKNIEKNLNSDLLILDRSYISIAAYQYALAMYRQTADSINAYNFIHKSLINAISNKTIIQPDVVIILLVAPTKSINRRIKYREDIETIIWFDLNFLNFFYEFYEKLKYRDYFTCKEITIFSENESVMSTYNKITSIIRE